MERDRVLGKKEREILLVAYDYCVLGLRGERLAINRQLSSATASRRLREAKEAGYIREAVLNIPSSTLEMIYPYICDMDLAAALQYHFGSANLGHVIIVPSAVRKWEDDDPYINKKRLGKAAAIRLLHLIEVEKMEKVGVGYGSTLRAMVDGLQNLVVPRERREQIEWIPICGDPPIIPDHPLDSMVLLSASTLVAELSLMFSNDSANQYLLHSPAYIPKSFIEKEDSKEEASKRLRMAREFIESIPTYKLIFGTLDEIRYREPDALIMQVDTIIASVGSNLEWLGTPGELASLGHIYSEREWKQLVDEGVVGDLCGAFITEEKVDGFSEDSAIAKVNARNLGCTPGDFRNCVARARSDGTPGVIIVAHGASKAKAVASTILNRCVTELICDSNLAEELAKTFGIRR